MHSLDEIFGFADVLALVPRSPTLCDCTAVLLAVPPAGSNWHGVSWLFVSGVCGGPPSPVTVTSKLIAGMGSSRGLLSFFEN